jgi:polyisoprenyl-phosphate glycosyltransferase
MTDSHDPPINQPLISVVVPCHNESANLAVLLESLQSALGQLAVRFEVLIVDDGSTDASYLQLAEASQHRPWLSVLRLARNFGKEAALTAGLDHAQGDAVILMDGDLQHPPEFLSTLITAWRDGADMVVALRAHRDDDGWLRRASTKLFYSLLNAMSEQRIPPGAGDFRLLSRRAVASIQALPERARFMKGLYALVGLNVSTVTFEPSPRAAGVSQYGIRKLWRLAIDGIASFTSAPLRVWSYLGLALAVPAGLCALWIVIRTLVFGVDTPGYASLATMILFFSGVQLIGLGVIGEYLGRVYVETKRRPLYVISDALGNVQATPHTAHGGIRLPARDPRHANAPSSEAKH